MGHVPRRAGSPGSNQPRCSHALRRCPITSLFRCKIVTLASAHNGCAVVCDETRRALGGVSKATGSKPHVTGQMPFVTRSRSSCMVPHYKPQRIGPRLHDKATRRHHRYLRSDSPGFTRLRCCQPTSSAKRMKRSRCNINTELQSTRDLLVPLHPRAQRAALSWQCPWSFRTSLWGASKCSPTAQIATTHKLVSFLQRRCSELM